MRQSITKRVAALESQFPERMPKVKIILQWQDGHCTHNALDYASLDEALEILRPEEHIVVQVQDMSKPAAKAKE